MMNPIPIEKIMLIIRISGSVKKIKDVLFVSLY
jgi:hypothetical protein